MLDGMSDYTTIKDRKSPLKGSRPSVPHGTNFSLYLNIRGLQKGPGKFFMGSWKFLEKSRIFFVSKRVGTLLLLSCASCWGRPKLFVSLTQSLPQMAPLSCCINLHPYICSPCPNRPKLPFLTTRLTVFPCFDMFEILNSTVHSVKVVDIQLLISVY